MGERAADDNFLRTGDLITLKFVRFQAFMSGEGILAEDIMVTQKMSPFEDHLFQVCAQRQYSAKSEYSEFVEKQGGKELKDEASKKHFAALVRGKGNEMRMNEVYMRHKIGNSVLFGDVVQLLHVKSRKYLTVRPGVLARDERENMSVHLSSEGNVFSWMQLLPRYKIDREGDRISNNTEVVMHVSERPSEHIHCSDRPPAGQRQREVNASMESGSPWRLNIYQTSQYGIDPLLLMGGQLVYIRDPEFFANLQVFTPPVVAKALMKKVQVEDESVISDNEEDSVAHMGSITSAKSGKSAKSKDSNKSKEESDDDDESVLSADEFIEDYGTIILKPSGEEVIDTNSIWVIESKVITKGGAVSWKQDQIHLRHLNSGQYLSSVDSGEDEYVMDSCLFTTQDFPTERNSLFNIFELHSQSDLLQTNKAIQLRQGHMYVERSEYNDRWKCFTCLGTRNRMKATNLIISRYTEVMATANSGIDIAMDVNVGISFLNVITKFLEVTKVPSIRDTKANSIWPDLDASERAAFGEAVELFIIFVKGFPIVHDDHILKTFIPDIRTIKRRQSLFREQGSLKVLLLILAKLTPISERLSSGDAAPHQFNEGGLLSTARTVVSLSLKILAEMTRNNHANQMYVAEFMSVVLSHCSSEKLAADITQEMLSTNRELQETKMGPDEIVVFSEKLRDSQMSAMFLRLIQACCSCKGVGVSHNQINIANILLGRFVEEFIEVSVNSANPRPIDWTSSSSSSLYLPPVGSVEVDFVLGKVLYTNGSPTISLTWTNLDKRVHPMTLFNKKYVKIWELYETLNKSKASSTGSSIFATMSVKQVSNETKSKDDALKEAVGDFFGAQISLAADMCLDRNYTVISKLIPLYPYEALVSIIRKPSTPSFLKASCISLLTNMYVDCDPQLSSKLPRLTRTWTEVCSEDSAGIRSVEESEKYRFGLLQVMISEHLRPLNARPYSLETHQMMVMLHRLLSFSFYGDSHRLLDVIDPLVAALDRRNVDLEDSIAVDAEKKMHQNDGPKTRGRRSSTADSKSRRQAAVGIVQVDAKGGVITATTQSAELKDDELEEVRMRLRWQLNVLNTFESVKFTMFMLVLVIVSVAQAVYQYLSDDDAEYLFYSEIAIFAAFSIDVLVRGYCFKIVRGSLMTFMTDPFNALDIIVVLVDAATYYLTYGLQVRILQEQTGFFKALKALRLLRLFRFMRFLRILNAIAANLTGVEIFKVEWVDPPRYAKNSSENIATMVEIANILGTIQLTVEDRNVSLLMRGFHKWFLQFKDDLGLTDDSKAAAVAIFEEVDEGIQQLRVSNDLYDNIFVDLMMYNSSHLVQSSMNILMTHHSSKKVLLANVNRMQLLVNHRREQQFEKLDKLVLLLKREADTHGIWGRLLTDEQRHTSEEAHRALKEIKQACYRRREVLKFDEEFEPDTIIQDILRNLGCFDVCIKLIELISDIDPHNLLSEQSRNTRTLALEASDLLYWFTIGNPRNQALGYKYIGYFMKNIDEKIKLHKVLEAIFYNNEFLMKNIPRQHISECVDMILNQGRFMQYLSLLGSIVAVGEKNMIENQYEIIRLLASPGNLKKVLLYFVPVSHPEYNKKLKAMSTATYKKDVSVEDLPSDLSYHLNLMSLLSGCTIGRDNMTTIEAKVQSMYSFVDVVEAIIDPQALLVCKIRTGLFFYNSMLDVEMRLPSLKDAKCVWDLLETMPEIFSFAKDDLRQIEKNGWAAASSNRQKIEYMLVCAMILVGYFTLYFDTTVFRPEVGQSSAVERVHIREKKAFELINSLFFKIRSIYEMQSPLIGIEHQEVLYKALCALNQANPNKIVVQVENFHSSGVEMGEHVKSAREEAKLKQFLAAITTNEEISELLGRETQDFIAKLEGLPRLDDHTSSSDVRYEILLKRIVEHIGNTIQTHVLGDEVVKFIDEQATATNLWFIKIFRTMIENKWGMTIYERDDDGGEEQDIAAEDVMRSLNACGATKVCLNLLGRGVSDELQAEAIKLIVALLFKEGGAYDVQKTIFETLNTPGSDLFFQHMRSMLAELMAWHKWHGVITLEEGEEPELPSEIILVRMLQLMCEGHYKPNQDILREQVNNRVTVNLLDDFTQYLQILDQNKCRTSTAAADAVTNTVLEVIQGPCEKNQDYFALSTELLETLNRRMRHHVAGDCDEDEENGVKKTVVDIFQGLLEGQGRRPAIYDRVLSVIHLDVIKMITTSEPADEEEFPESFVELKMECLVFLMMLFDYRSSLRTELDMEEHGELEEEVACVELVWRGELQRRFFNVPGICLDIAKSSKDDFVASADRESSEAKLFDLIAVARSMHREILHQQLLKYWRVDAIFSKANQARVAKFTFLLACVVNGLFIAYYENLPCDGEEDTETKDDDGGHYVCLKTVLPTDVDGLDMNVVVQVLGIILIVFSSYSVILCLVVRLPVKYEALIEDGKSQIMASIHTAMDGKTVYHTGYLIFSCLSLYTKLHHLASFLLLDMISMSPVTQDTLNAIWKPRRMLMMTIALTFIVVYVYAIMAFFLYNDEENFAMNDGDDGTTYNEMPNMNTLVNAFKEFVRYGSPSGSLNNDMVQNVYTARWFSDVTFYMVCFTLWNVIKGITIDTFVELRRDLVVRMEDTEEKCYVCGIEKLVFNRALDRNAFDLHIKKDQNLWNYVYYCIFIWEQDKDDDDGLEYYVRHCVEDADLTWFPMNKAIRLAEHLEQGAADSLPYLFRNDLNVMSNAVEGRMSLLKDALQRSITRVEQALTYQPESTVTKAKKKRAKTPQTAQAQDNAQQSPSVNATSRLGSAPFRPMTGTLAADFASIMEGKDDFAPANADQEVDVALQRRDKSLGYWRTQAYMDQMQLHVACNELEGLYVTPDMIGNVSVRLIADTGVFMCSSGFDDSSSLAESTRELRDSHAVKATEPISFNKSEFFIVYGGALPKSNTRALVIQVLVSQKFDVPTEVADAYPNLVHRCVAYGTVSINDLVESASGMCTLKMPLKQFAVDRSPLSDCTLQLNTTASEHLISEFASNAKK